MLAHGEIKSALGISARHPRTFQSGSGCLASR